MPIIPNYPLPDGTEISEEEYLVSEPQSEYKSEFRQGRIYAMSGATEAHVLVSGNVFAEIHRQLKGRPCKAFQSDMRTKVVAARLYTYPDVIVVCGPTVFDVKDKHAIVNPTVLVEVLSKSTEAYDRGKKFGNYKKLDSLKEYVLVSQNKVLVEHFTWNAGEWHELALHSLDDTLELTSIGCKVSVRDIYDKVDFNHSDEEE